MNEMEEDYSKSLIIAIKEIHKLEIKLAAQVATIAQQVKRIKELEAENEGLKTGKFNVVKELK